MLNLVKGDPRNVILGTKSIIVPQRKQLIYQIGKRYFDKYSKERITFSTFYISKGFEYTDGKGEKITYEKGDREFNPPFKNISDRWRRIDFLPKEWRRDLRDLTTALGWSVNPEHLHGFLPRRSVRTCATEMFKANSVIEVDAKDAFHQLHRREIVQILRRDLDWNKEQAEWFAKLCAPKGKAQMGNPLVPILFNIKIAKILRKANARIRKAGIVAYGVSYADDICFLSDKKRLPRKEIDTIECIIGNYLKLNKKKTKIRHKAQGFHKLGLTIHRKGITSAYKYKRLHMVHKKYATETEAWKPKTKNHGKWDRRADVENHIWGHLEWITYNDFPGQKSRKLQDKINLSRRFDIPTVLQLVIPAS